MLLNKTPIKEMNTSLIHWKIASLKCIEIYCYIKCNLSKSLRLSYLSKVHFCLGSKMSTQIVKFKVLCQCKIFICLSDANDQRVANEPDRVTTAEQRVKFIMRLLLYYVVT